MVEDDITEEYFCFFVVLFHLVELSEEYIEVLVMTIDHETLNNLRTSLFIFTDNEFCLDRFVDILEC